MTDVALKEYLDRRVDELEKRVFDRFAQNEQGVSKAERTMNERLNSMNEFRDALRDQSSRMITRPEHDKLDSDVRQLQQAKANLDGRMAVLSAAVSIGVYALLWGLSQLVGHAGGVLK